jgi:hypothetical protein
VQHAYEKDIATQIPFPESFGNYDPAVVFSSKKFFKLFSLLTDKVLERNLREIAKS